ncbi:sigma 54-interacting transcriptional regulator [Lacipirellula sp.]|uniref:sigma 54-interacting transcriptional regulator n=1 Tax=Lacipirellula sp. TaxID=2691419 RepID=UPI003D114800
MESSRSRTCTIIDLKLRQVEAATRRFAIEFPPDDQELLAVLLIGPCAANKVDLARRLHGIGPRSPKPFVRIDCRHSAGVQFAALNGTIRSTRPIAGTDDPPRHFFRIANGGTLFFDHWLPGTRTTCAHLFAELNRSHSAPLAAADPFAIDVAVTIAVDARWTDRGDDECLMMHVPLATLDDYLAYLNADAHAELLAAN